MSTSQEIGQYVLPIYPSIENIGPNIDRTLGKAFGNVSKTASQALASGVRDGVKEAEAAVKKSSDTIAKLRDKEAAAADKLATAEARIEEVREKGGSALKRAEAQRNSAYRAQEAALREIEQQTRSLERAQRSLADAQEEAARGGAAQDGLRSIAGAALSSGTEAAAGFVDGFGGPIAALGTKAGPVGLALAAAAGVALSAGALIGKQVLAGMEREVASDRLAAQLGLTPGEAAQFGDSAGKTYAANFGESLGDVNDAMAQVTSTLGKGTSASVIEDMTAKALTFRDVFGTDVAESIAHAQNLIANGLAPDAAAAFDLMTTAYQRVPAAMRDELPEILNEYSTYFQSLGFSGAEAFGMLVNTAPRGKIALDKLGDSLKEFTLLATDLGAKPVQEALAGLGLDGSTVANNLLAGGAAAQAQFDQIVEGLLRIPDAGQQASAAVALFGTPLEDLDKAKIPQFLTSLSNADQAMQGFAGSAQQMVATVGDNAAGSVESARRAIENAAGGMQDSLAQAFGPHVEQFANWLTEHQDEVTHAFQWMAGAATEFGAIVGLAIGSVITTFGLMVEFVGNASGLTVDAFEAMIGAAATAADALGMDGMADTLRGAQETLGGFSDTLHGLGEGITAFGFNTLGAADQLRTFDGHMAGTSTSSRNAAAQIDRVTQAIRQLPDGKKINIEANSIVVYRDPNGRAIDPSQLLGYDPSQFATVGDAQRARRGLPYNPATPTPPAGAPSVTPQWTPPAASGSSQAPPPYFDPSLWQVDSVPPSKFSDVNLVPNAARLNDLIAATFPQITDIGGYRANGGGSNDHPSGQALDIMIPGWDTAGGKALGDQINDWLHNNAAALGLDSTIWQDFWQPVAGDGHRLGRQGANEGHYNHIHAKVRPGGAATGDLFGPTGYRPDLFTPAPTDLHGTAGAGGYVVDPQAVYDAESQVISARNTLEQKRLKLLELEATGNATQAQLLAARNDVGEQERSYVSAQMKFAEAQRGKFKEASKATKSASDGGGTGDLSPLGGIFGSFLKETLGIDGSLFPDLADLMPIKMGGAALSAFKGPLLGLLQGHLGIQQPGWEPGMPVQVPAASGGGGGLPSGLIPNVFDVAGYGQPGMAPPGTPASGIGSGPAPGPPPGPVDQSRHMSVTVNGYSQDEVIDAARRSLFSVDRQLTYAIPGMN